MTWGRTLEKVLSSNGLPTDFAAWYQLAADRCAWRLVCGGSAGPAPSVAKDRQTIWAELRNGPEKAYREPQLILRQVNVQSAQPAQAGGAAETNQNYALALLLTLLLLFAQCKTHYGD